MPSHPNAFGGNKAEPRLSLCSSLGTQISMSKEGKKSLGSRLCWEEFSGQITSFSWSILCFTQNKNRTSGNLGWRCKANYAITSWTRRVSLLWDILKESSHPVRWSLQQLVHVTPRSHYVWSLTYLVVFLCLVTFAVCWPSCVFLCLLVLWVCLGCVLIFLVVFFFVFFFFFLLRFSLPICFLDY